MSYLMGRMEMYSLQKCGRAIMNSVARCVKGSQLPYCSQAQKQAPEQGTCPLWTLYSVLFQLHFNIWGLAIQVRSFPVTDTQERWLCCSAYEQAWHAAPKRKKKLPAFQHFLLPVCAMPGSFPLLGYNRGRRIQRALNGLLGVFGESLAKVWGPACAWVHMLICGRNPCIPDSLCKATLPVVIFTIKLGCDSLLSLNDWIQGG